MPEQDPGELSITSSIEDKRRQWRDLYDRFYVLCDKTSLGDLRDGLVLSYMKAMHKGLVRVMDYRQEPE